MKYALLLYDNPAAWENVDDDEMKELHHAYMAVAEEPEAYGGAQLRPANESKVVRGDLVTDGPFTETKEVLSGFYLVDAPSKERALELALQIPTVSRMGGAIEIRPLVER
jgi:hypothetical protein